MTKIYHCRIEVRGYELDSFGHLNHAMYVSYLEHARWKLLEEEGVSLARFEEWKRWPVIARIEVDYLKPAFMGEQLDVRTQLAPAGRTAFVAEQVIVRGETAVLEAKVKVVMVNEKGKPSELPSQLLSRLWRPSSTEKNG